MTLNISVQTDLTAELAELLANRASKAEQRVAEEVRSDTAPYVPFLTGALDRGTRVVGNTVIYPGPYAQFLYYGKVMIDPNTGSAWARQDQRKVVTDRNLVFTKTFHPDAQSHWFEASKAQNLDKWIRIAREAVAKDG